MATSQKTLVCAWGTTGQPMRYQVLDPSGGVLVARTAAGVSELPAGSGNYVAVASWDDATDAIVIWDDNAGNYSSADFWDRRIASIFAQTILIQGSTGTQPPIFSAIGDAQNGYTAVAWRQVFNALQKDISGWTSLTFTVKESPTTQTDSEALIVVRVSNPPAPSDGLIFWKGQPVVTGNPMQAAGAASVAIVSGTTSVSVSLSSDAMNVDDSPKDAPYTYEINFWTGAAGSKDQLGIGDFNVARSVRRLTASP